MEMNKLNMPGPKILDSGSLHKWFTKVYDALPAVTQFAIGQLAESMGMFERQLLLAEDTIRRVIVNTPRFQAPIERLMTLPGVGLVTAAVIYAETGGLGRFGAQLSGRHP